MMGVGPLVSFVWINKLGDLATSPQRVEMNLGTTSFVAGGRAKLWFAAVDLGPQVEVSCKRQTRMIELTDRVSDEVCGIRIRSVALKERDFKGYHITRGEFEVTWDDRR